MSKRYFLTDGTNTFPVSAAGLRKLAETGRLAPTDRVLIEGMSKWVPASKLKGLFPEPVLEAELVEEVLEAELVEEQPKSPVDQLSEWVAQQLAAHTGCEIDAETAKLLTMAALAQQAAGGGGGGGRSSGGMGRHEANTTSQINAMQGAIDAGGTMRIRYF